jgi:hypothetical protein
MTAAQAPAAVRASDVPIDPDRPLLIVDVDEVLAFFIRGFDAYLNARGYELRMTRFALFQNLYPVGGAATVPVPEGKAMFDDFFATSADRLDPVPGAAEGLRRLSDTAQIVVLTNAPAAAREGRARWLAAHDMAYPLIINEGLKGPECARLSGRTRGRAAFVDDLLPNLMSVAKDAPAIVLFQSVADPVLRPLAPTDAAVCARHDDWSDLAPALERALAA